MTISRSMFFSILLSSALIFLHALNVQLRWYIPILFLSVLASWLIHRSLLTALWHIYITILPISLSRNFFSSEIPAVQWGGEYDVVFNYFLKYSQILFIGVIYFLLRDRKKFTTIPFTNQNALLFFFPILFIFFNTIAALHSHVFPYVIYQFFLFIFILAHFFISFFLLRDWKIFSLTLHVWWLQTVLLCVLLLLQFVKGSQLGIGLEQRNDASPQGSVLSEIGDNYRPGGYFFDPNVAATWLMMLGPLILFYFIQEGRNENITFMHSLLFLAGLIVTQSRFPWILAIVFIFFCWWLIKRKKIFSFHLPRRAALFIIAFFILAAPFLLWRFSTLRRTFQPGGGKDYRLTQFFTSTQSMLASPWGIGVGTIEYEVLGILPASQFSHDVVEPHNIFIQVGVGLGIFGLIAFCFFLYVRFRQLIMEFLHNKQPLFFGLLLSCFGYVSLANVYPWLLNSPLAELFWLLFGLPSIALLQSKKYIKNKSI